MRHTTAHHVDVDLDDYAHWLTIAVRRDVAVDLRDKLNQAIERMPEK